MSRPIAKDHDAKRMHILKVAARVFADQGFARASMAQVAKDCGISKANIYHYYSSKDALLFDILDTYLSALRDRILGLDLAGLAPEAQLGRIVTETLRAYEGMDHEHKIQTEGIPLLPPEQQKILKAYQRDLVGQMSGIVAAIAPEAFAQDSRKLRATVMSIFGMLNWFYMWNSPADRQARDDYAGLVTRLTLSGLRGL
ncbi:transcriptional regulator PaaY (plasmid) [Dinoroseobacter shibae DFL 12 = DSM 16493]|uniref:Transcriptional regulator PaaY n=1 Tax=Dinoroseobacter shibae (strain DSM 16493 / NCIMB 14021 / DFL 12) TaxID=398580 RepID=A8LTI6_DINSH|nr:TetR/AcrR family transcriptional regulator [Dinoroseobacter shibae]ABV95553.1 transcriptional regulator PaaY [Dinoroseobacter shibae DFL 12 = DSM 16493]URF48893.1 TetR/AcrR family transcriptional regulator [Dinoroseobacter shibae]URF53205.1 TetR/AcrR family transcriptional regulator [Dinoroseobacter shibae]